MSVETGPHFYPVSPQRFLRFMAAFQSNARFVLRPWQQLPAADGRRITSIPSPTLRFPATTLSLKGSFPIIMEIDEARQIERGTVTDFPTGETFADHSHHFSLPYQDLFTLEQEKPLPIKPLDSLSLLSKFHRKALRQDLTDVTRLGLLFSGMDQIGWLADENFRPNLSNVDLPVDFLPKKVADFIREMAKNQSLWKSTRVKYLLWEGTDFAFDHASISLGVGIKNPYSKQEVTITEETREIIVPKEWIVFNLTIRWISYAWLSSMGRMEE